MSRFLPANAPPSPLPIRRRTKRSVSIAGAVMGGVLLAGMAGQAVLYQASQRKAETTVRSQREKQARDAWDAATKLTQRDRAALIALVNQSPTGSRVTRPFLSGLPNTRQGVVSRNQPALRALRAAFLLPYRAAPDPSADRYGIRADANFRPLGCLLLLDGNEKASQNDAAGAADAYLDLIQMGQILPRGGALSALLSGGAYQRMGQKSLWELAGKMDGETARRAARRLETLDAAWEERAGYPAALQEEKQRGEAALREQLRNPKQMRAAQQRMVMITQFMAQMQAARASGGRIMVSFRSPASSPPTPPPTLWNKTAQAWDNWKALREFDVKMDALLVQSRQPYQTWQQNAAPRSQTVSGGWFGQAIAQGTTSTPTIPLFYTYYGSPITVGYAQKEWTAQRTQNRLLMVALAIQAFRKNHQNRDPAALSDLVPAYLSRVPNDPYSLPVAPLIWKPALYGGTAGVLYSVGPDGKDDNGVPVQGFLRQGGMNGMFNWYASYRRPVGKGDLVAGKTPP